MHFFAKESSTKLSRVSLWEYESPTTIRTMIKFLESTQMKKVIATLVAGLFASAVFAQAPVAPATPAAPAAKTEMKAPAKHHAKKKATKKKAKAHKKAHTTAAAPAPAVK